MRAAALFALLTLVSATVSAATPASQVLVLALCNGGRTNVPVGPAPRNDNGCCTKACHTGCSRKRAQRQI